MSLRIFLKFVFSAAPSAECGGSDSGLGFGFTGGGVFVRCLCRGSPSFGSRGSLKVRCGLGDRTGVEDACNTGRLCSNMFTSALVGGIGVSSVGLSRAACCARAIATGSVLAPALLGLGTFCCLESSLASTFPTLPAGGSTSRSFASRSVMIGVDDRCGTGFMGLCRAAASFAAMFEGEGTRSKLSSGTARVLELLDLPGVAVSAARAGRAAEHTQRWPGRGIGPCSAPRAPAGPVPPHRRRVPRRSTRADFGSGEERTIAPARVRVDQRFWLYRRLRKSQGRAPQGCIPDIILGVAGALRDNSTAGAGWAHRVPIGWRQTTDAADLGASCLAPRMCVAAAPESRTTRMWNERLG